MRYKKKCPKIFVEKISPIFGVGIRLSQVIWDFSASLLSENLHYIKQYSFYRCSGLKGSLIIPDTVTFIDAFAFYGCVGFNEILKLSGNLQIIDKYSFCQCNNFTGSLTIPDNVT